MTTTRTVHECVHPDTGEPRIDQTTGEPVTGPDVKTCWGCLGQWCDRCDPTPAALCVFCHGRGESDHELDYDSRTRRYYNGRSTTRIERTTP